MLCADIYVGFVKLELDYCLCVQVVNAFYDFWGAWVWFVVFLICEFWIVLRLCGSDRWCGLCKRQGSLLICGFVGDMCGFFGLMLSYFDGFAYTVWIVLYNVD
eukprot:gene2682-1680_t